MQNNLTSSLKYISNSKSDTLDVLLHGGAGGMEQTLMKKLFDACVGLDHSVVSFNFPFFERGDEHSSGPELKEEIETLKYVLSHCGADKYKHVRLIGKSLGGIIIGKFLSQLEEDKQSKYSVIVFGYVTGDVDLKQFNGRISIIQGQKDKYGGIEIVEKDMEGSLSKDVHLYQIVDGDHSYRNEEKEPVYEDEAIEIFKTLSSQ